MKEYPGKLYHNVPSWVKPGAVYHIRIRCLRGSPVALTDTLIAPNILDSVRFYHKKKSWFCRLFLLMPDHIHATMSFSLLHPFSRTVGKWKGFQSVKFGVQWQENFFDHRIRSDRELEEKEAYIRRNTVAKGLCARPQDWPWVISPAQEELDELERRED